MTEIYKTIDFDSLQDLKNKNIDRNNETRVLKCQTIAKQRFIHHNFIRDLPAHIIDEPKALLGDNTAPNPSEAALAALGSCIAVGIQANLVDKNIAFQKIALELHAEIDITATWGVGNTTPKQIGFTKIEVIADVEAELKSDELDELLNYVLAWSPVTGTYVNPVPVSIQSKQ